MMEECVSVHFVVREGETSRLVSIFGMRNDFVDEHPIRPRATGCAHQARDTRPLPPDTSECQDHQQMHALRHEVSQVTPGREEALPCRPEPLLHL